MLVRVWTEVQNGGFGPGNGLGGIPPNGYVDDDLGADCIEHYLANVDDPLSMSKSLMICNWGCAIWSLVDCNDPAGRILTDEVLQNEAGQMSIRYYEVCPSLEEWLAKWVSDVSLWDDMHDVVGEVTRYNPFKRQLETRPDKRLKGAIVYQSPFRG